MPYLKPPFFVRAVFNPIAMRLGLSGTETLVVTGRRSGKPQEIPVIPVEVNGKRYIVSTRGEAEWVRNVRATGTVELVRKGTHNRYRASEVPIAERDPIIAAYRAKAGKTVESYWKTLPDAADHPTFRLEPAT